MVVDVYAKLGTVVVVCVCELTRANRVVACVLSYLAVL